ncbi:PlySs2 family phage lysin [Streptococcus minor]|uniref:PlySs2 family phage lysin n=1 Tax=Streptococcus minor TaxID=229549 RepID=UPI000363D295|nr:PlySs2 family phage lysin [Streptococcus minor]
MATVNEALNNVRAHVNSGKSIGNGECYGLASWYESMITPGSVVGLGAGIGWVTGAIGDTMAAHNIGSSYNWAANGWNVSKTGPFKSGQIVTMYGGTYGHVAIVESIDGDRLVILEQNYAGKRYVTRNVYSASSYARNIAHYITPPGSEVTQKTVPTQSAGARTYAESGTMTVMVDALNVRRAPNTSGQIVATYTKGQSFKYDTVIIDANGYVWVSYVGGSGKRNYVATGATRNGSRYGAAWGTFK